MARGTRLASEAFALLRDDRRLLLLPAAALLVDVICVGLLLVLAAAASGRRGHETVLLVSFALALYPLTVSSTFFNVALMHVVSQRWRGQQAGVRDGLLLARRRLGTILAWVARGHGGNRDAVGAAHRSFRVDRASARADAEPRLVWGDVLRRPRVGTRRHRPVGCAQGVLVGRAAAVAREPDWVDRDWWRRRIRVDPWNARMYDWGLRIQLRSSLWRAPLMIGVAMGLPVMLYLSATSAVFSLAVWEYANHGVQSGPFTAEDLQRPFRGGEQIANARRWTRHASSAARCRT